MFSRSHSEETLYIKNESPASPDRLSGSSPVGKDENKDGVGRMDCKRYALRWRHHQSTVVAEVGYLYRDAALVDVTLACEDQRTYQAHKLVLSACSQYFQTLFSRHPAHQHPIIFLKDVSGDECEALLTYMYRGEVSVNQDQIPRILRVASSLQVRGLAEVETQNSRPSSPSIGDRGAQCPSSSPSPSTGPPTKCVTPLSEPQSPNGPNNAITSQSSHTLGSCTESESVRHPTPIGGGGPRAHTPPASLAQDIPPYPMFPHHRPYDPIGLFGPLSDHERKRIDDKVPPAHVGPYPPTLRVKQDLASSNWEGGGVDPGGLSPLALPEASRPHFLPPAIFSSFINQDQHLPTVPQGYGRIFSISDPIRRVDRLCPNTGGDPRIHKCQFCSRKFKRKDHLKTHVRIHTGERPYKCKVCGRGFIQSQQVKIHMKVHVREDASSGLGATSLLGGGARDARTLAALYPELATHYTTDAHTNERGLHSSRNDKDLVGPTSPNQGSMHADSDNDNDISSETADGAEFDSPKDHSGRLHVSASSFQSGSSSFFSRVITPTSNTSDCSNNNKSPSPMAANHSGGRGSPPNHPRMDTSSPDETCEVKALKESTTLPYHISANLKK